MRESPNSRSNQGWGPGGRNQKGTRQLEDATQHSGKRRTRFRGDFRLPVFAMVFGFIAMAGMLRESRAVQESDKEYASLRFLKSRGIEPDKKGIEAFARRLKPDESLKAELSELIDQLSSPSYRNRNDAFKKLQGFPFLPIELLKEARKSSNPEVRFRAAALLKKANQELGPLVNNVLVVIEREKITGLLQQVMDCLEANASTQTIGLAERAATVTVTLSDAEVLSRWIRSANPIHRKLVIGPWIKIQPDSWRDSVRQLLKDRDDSVRLAAAFQFANQGERESLDVLVKLLESSQINIRTRAMLILRAATEQKFDFIPYAKKEKRELSIEKWQSWLAENADATPRFPIKFQRSRSRLDEGHMLLAYGHAGTVVETGPDGKELFRFQGHHVWSAEKLHNGNILVSEYSKNRVAELDMQGKVVWEFRCKTCLMARVLDNGNVLCVSHTGKKIMEVTREKEVVWEIETSGYGCDAHRLPNGNTLISEDGKVRIVDQEKKEVWSIDASHPYGVEPLPNGNILICDITKNHVIEVDRNKETVWKFTAKSPCDAFRLANGNTLITDHERFAEVTPDKKIVWEKKGARYGTARK